MATGTPLLTKDMVVKTTMATIGSAFILGVTGALSVDGYKDEVESRLIAVETRVATNTDEIAKTSLRSDVNSVTQRIVDLEQERRTLRRELRQDPNNALLIDQLDEVDGDLAKLNESLNCFRDNPKHPELCQPDR